MDWHSVKGGVVILLVWDNFRLVGSLGSSSDFVVVSIDALRLVINFFNYYYYYFCLSTVLENLSGYSPRWGCDLSVSALRPWNYASLLVL